MNDGTSFATQQLAQSYAQVSVDLKKALDDNSAALTDSLNKQQVAFQKQLERGLTGYLRQAPDKP